MSFQVSVIFTRNRRFYEIVSLVGEYQTEVLDELKMQLGTCYVINPLTLTRQSAETFIAFLRDWEQNAESAFEMDSMSESSSAFNSDPDDEDQA